jgi:hypothetical protein
LKESAKDRLALGARGALAIVLHLQRLKQNQTIPRIEIKHRQTHFFINWNSNQNN